MGRVAGTASVTDTDKIRFFPVWLPFPNASDEHTMEEYMQGGVFLMFNRNTFSSLLGTTVRMRTRRGRSIRGRIIVVSRQTVIVRVSGTNNTVVVNQSSVVTISVR